MKTYSSQETLTSCIFLIKLAFYSFPLLLMSNPAAAFIPTLHLYRFLLSWISNTSRNLFATNIMMLSFTENFCIRPKYTSISRSDWSLSICICSAHIIIYLCSISIKKWLTFDREIHESFYQYYIISLIEKNLLKQYQVALSIDQLFRNSTINYWSYIFLGKYIGTQRISFVI
jgi:hypothetical protein